jgi:hypothetical protein
VRTCPSCQFLIDDDAQICAICHQPVAAPQPALAHAAGSTAVDPTTAVAPAPPDWALPQGVAPAPAFAPPPPGWAPPPGYAPVPPAAPPRSTFRRILIGLAVVAIAYGGFLGVKAVLDARSGGLGEFDPASLAWQTHHDASGRFTVDLPGPAQIEPAQAGEPAAVSTDGAVSVGVAWQPLGPGDAMVDLATFTDGLAGQLQESFDVEQVVVRNTSEEAGPDGRTLLAEFEGIMDGTPIVGVTEIKSQASSMIVMVTVGIREERTDVVAVQDRVASSLVVVG